MLARRVRTLSTVALGLSALVALSACGGSAQSEDSNGQDAEETGFPMTDDPIADMNNFIEAKNLDLNKDTFRTQLPKPPQANFPEGKTYFWNLKTNVGDIKIRLMHDIAPMHVSSTIYLTLLGFYDALRFHRIINGFMAQGGCPLGTGRGSPGYKYDGEFDPDVRHDKPGLLSMANSGPGTDGSQFFLTFVPTPHLDGKHTIVGEVVEGMDAVEKLEEVGTRSGQPTEKMMIEEATITVE